MTILDIKNLNVKFKSCEVLQDITISIKKGDYIAVVGPNGAGKTTFIRALLGLVDRVEGEIIFQSSKIGYLQQKVSLNDSKFPASVEEIIKSGLLINKKFPKIFNRKDKEIIKEIISLLDISNLKDKKIGKLSGGELQKVLLARALVSKPEILFLDEPTTALDPLSRDHFYNLLGDLNEKKKITILLISHDMGSVGKYAEKLLYIDQKLIFYGTFDEFCQSAEMTRFFGNTSQHIICQRHN